MKAGKVHWYCASAEHRLRRQRDYTHRLTIIAGQWAFCPLDARLPEHDWRRVGGVDIEHLARVGIRPSQATR